MAAHLTGPADTVPLRTGAEMPVLGLGTWQLTRDTAGTVGAAVDLGYRMVDTSGDYGTEPGVGEGLRRSSVPRDTVFVVTKVEEDEDAYASSADRLDALGLDHVDLLLLHRPPARGIGVALWRGLQRARDDGRTRAIGVSNYSIDQIDGLEAETGELPVVNQIEWSPFGWSRAMLDACRDRDIVVQAYSPLTRAERLDDEVLTELAAGHGRSPAQVLLRWDLQLGVVPLPKANDREHLRANLDVFDFSLTDDDMDRLEQRNEHYSSLGGHLAYR